jgi:hypothetical protein
MNLMTPLAHFAQIPLTLQLVIYGILGLIGFVIVIVVANFAHVWVRAWSAGAPVGFIELISLRLRGVPVGLIVDNRITAVKSGLLLTIDDSPRTTWLAEMPRWWCSPHCRAKSRHSSRIRSRLRHRLATKARAKRCSKPSRPRSTQK